MNIVERHVASVKDCPLRLLKGAERPSLSMNVTGGGQVTQGGRCVDWPVIGQWLFTGPHNGWR
jgi:hypothetical protein